MKTILITGINGFLGSHLAKKLMGSYKVIGLEYSIDNLFRLKDCAFQVYKSDNISISELFDNHAIDIIIHTATFYGRNNEFITQMAETNFLMPFHLLDKAIAKGVSTFINTDTVLDRFVSPYALTKRHFQEWLYFRRKEINAVNMQLEHFYGPGCSDSNFITAMIKRLKSNEPFIDLTAGEQRRDFVYYTDIINAYEVVITNLDSLPGNYSNYEVASGELIMVKDIMRLLKQFTNSNTTLNFGAVSYRENEPMISKADNADLLALGWTAKVSIQEGLQKTINL